MKIKTYLHVRFGDLVLRVSNSWQECMIFTKYDIPYRKNGKWFEVVEVNFNFSSKI